MAYLLPWQVAAKRQVLLEKLADVDEEVAELYLTEEEPSVELLMAAIRRQTIARNFVPVCMGRRVGPALCHGSVALRLAGVPALPPPALLHASPR